MWFEHDLLDQLQIIQLLDWFAGHPISPTELSIICINHFEEIVPFRGIGQLNTAQMATLFTQRVAVSQTQLNDAQACWNAYRSPSPEALTRFIKQSEQSLPFLQKALIRHRQEYPSLSDGLSRTERQLLTLVSEGITQPGKLFNHNMEMEDVLYIGDWTTYRIIDELCSNTPPLIQCEPSNQFIHPPGHKISQEKFNQQTLVVTSAGIELLSGKTHGSNSIHRDCWLGGVHISSDSRLWLWDDANQRFVIHNP